MNDDTATLPFGYRVLGPVSAPVGTILITPSTPRSRRWSELLRTWAARRRHPAPRRRPDFFEASAMAREMHRL
ncbi:hypothetical protein MMUR_17100 [Mycolicibacterium murale]|uniref:Uncharacterized protein n=1 Tax=Mycolicibacterium murale TaxID=182220 RepID=A0A7I9WIS5_9MYCO|nr:hypothetical protein [Mycolicibacterium murale]MCV7183954.1 hypothetical protein [Mycolicibacterium murale]GFG57574.1 hypothetical protein MMUR_17100 [Mycolicibacterium murale]